MSRALRCYADRHCQLEPQPAPPEPGPGEVVIAGHYSAVNYKDALAVTGRARILRRLPLTPGIDVAGEVLASADPRWRPGDAVLVTGCGLGERIDGGYAAWVRVPGECVVALPAGLTPRQAMLLGTAGFTAALAIQRLEENHQRPALGPMVVTGATGGVGSLAVQMLAGLGFDVVAVTGKADRADWLRGLGAAEILLRQDVDFGEKPLETARWGGAIDMLGDDWLAWLTRTVRPHGNIAAVGLAAGYLLETTVMPFILRGISLLGINSVDVPAERRRAIWQRLAGPLRPPRLDDIAAGEITLDEVPAWCERMLTGQSHGRMLVRLADA